MQKTRTAILREAIEEVLLSASAPLTAMEIAQAPSVAALGVSEQNVQSALYTMHQNPHLCAFKMVRVQASRGDTSAWWEYYNPDVLTTLPKRSDAPRATRRKKPARRRADRASLPAAQPGEFKFNPEEFLQDIPESARQVGPFPVEPGSAPVAPERKPRAMSISVGGVTVRIEME